MAPHDPEARLRLSIDIVGPHSLTDAAGAQREIRQAVLAWVAEGVRIDEVSSHLHEAGCEFCRASVEDPSRFTRILDRASPGDVDA